jgi:hypothetical protein
MLHFVPATTMAAVNVVGGQARGLTGNGWWFAGYEFDYGELAGRQPMTAVAHGGMPAMPPITSADIAQSKLLVGARASTGPLTFSGELAGGLQIASYATTETPMDQMWYIVELRAQCNLWIAPKLTLGVQSSLDVVNANREQISLLVGYHMSAFDGRRY